MILLKLTNYVTPWSRVLLEKIIITQLVKKFSTFYGTHMFVTMFTRARHWSLSWAGYIQSTTSHPLYLISILILSPHLCVGLSSGLFKFSNQNIVCISHVSHACYMPHLCNSSWILRLISKKQDVRIWTCCIWLGMGTSGELLWRRKFNFGFHKRARKFLTNWVAINFWKKKTLPAQWS